MECGLALFAFGSFFKDYSVLSGDFAAVAGCEVGTGDEGDSGVGASGGYDFVCFAGDGPVQPKVEIVEVGVGKGHIEAVAGEAETDLGAGPVEGDVASVSEGAADVCDAAVGGRCGGYSCLGCHVEGHGGGEDEM